MKSSFIVIFLFKHVISYDILYLAPLPAVSHFQMLEPLMIALAEKGHNITVLSHYPQKTERLNYSDVSLKGTMDPYALDFESWGMMPDFLETFRYGADACETVVSSPVIQDFVKNNRGRKFDLIFVEAFDSECYLGFVEFFKAPYILYSAMALPVWESDWIYNPTEASYVPEHMCRLSRDLDRFTDRVQNLFCHVTLRLLYYWYSVRSSTDIVNRHFNLNLKSLEETKKNVSMVFVNSFHAINGIRPMLPNVVELGGIHMKPQKKLPDNIEKFLNEATEGAILFSMGSMVKSHTLDSNVKNGFVSVFRRLKEKVLWKWEKDFPDQPGNIMTSPWVPQADVLAHPNIKLFISHGGIHGIIEAIHYGVPIVGMPLYGDQETNLKQLESLGAAILVNFNNLNVDEFESAVHQVLNNKSYKENAQRLSKIHRDRPLTPLQTAIYWTEYVIEHKGAPHFKSGALRLTWIQYHLIDVWLAGLMLLTVLVSIFYIPLKCMRKKKELDKKKKL